MYTNSIVRFFFFVFFFNSIQVFGQIKIAIIGGGMAGVSSAYFISQFDSTAQITLFEKEAVLGGNGQTINVKLENRNVGNIDLGPQYYAEESWEEYLAFLETVLGKESLKSESMIGTISIQKENIIRPNFISPLGLKLRGEKLSQLLLFKKFNDEAYKLYKNENLAKGLSIETWVEQLNFKSEFKTQIIYPFLAASLGTSISEIKKTSAWHIIKLFAFRKAKANNKFFILTDGMGKQIQKIGDVLNQKGVRLKLNSTVYKVVKSNDKWNLSYKNGGEEMTESFDFVIFACHADQVSKLIHSEKSLSEWNSNLDNLHYFPARIALHTDSTFVNFEKDAFLNITVDSTNEIQSSSMNLGMISNRMKGVYKSWLNVEQIESLRLSGKLIHETVFYHPLITPEFVAILEKLESQVAVQRSLYIAGGWTEGLETQNSAVISGQKTLDKYRKFMGY